MNITEAVNAILKRYPDYSYDIFLDLNKFKEWANENGEYQYSSTKFGLEMSKKFEKKRRRSGNVYIGIEPLQNSEYSFNFQP